MSLIDDALKRAQTAGEGEAARQANRPWIPAPMPDASLARRRRLLRWPGAALAGLLVVAGVWLFRAETNRSLPLPAAAGRSVGRLAAVQPTPTLVAVTVPAPPAAHPRPALAVVPAEERLSEGGPPEVPVPAPARPAPAMANGRTYAGFVTLPGGAKIELGGIVWSETEPRALLNDRVSGVGAYVEGFTVSKIEADRVALEKDGLTIYLSLK